MNFKELLELLEIDTPDDFSYFEHFAALVEIDEEIPYELFFRVLAEVDSESLADLTDNYFEEILQAMPDDSIDIYTLFNTIRQSLIGLAKASTTREERVLFADELFKFRTWYTFDSLVYCKNLKDNAITNATICEALALYRIEKLSEEQYSYDFSECLDYDIDEYTLTLNTKIVKDYDELLEDEDDEDNYEQGLIDHDYPVIDGEDYEEEEEEY